MNLDTAYAYINTIKAHLSKAFEDDNIIEIVECISAGFGMQEMMLTYLFKKTAYLKLFFRYHIVFNKVKIL